MSADFAQRTDARMKTPARSRRFLSGCGDAQEIVAMFLSTSSNPRIEIRRTAVSADHAEGGGELRPKSGRVALLPVRGARPPRAGGRGVGRIRAYFFLAVFASFFGFLVSFF
jgi:hypothetical protein